MKEKAFENKNVYEKVLIFNKTVLNILSNFIPNELIECDDVTFVSQMPFELRDAWLKTKVQLKAGDKVAQCPKNSKPYWFLSKTYLKTWKFISWK